MFLSQADVLNQLPSYCVLSKSRISKSEERVQRATRSMRLMYETMNNA